MPRNDSKIIDIIKTECQTVDERCEKYRETIFETLADIILEESQHRVKGTNIQQKVKDKCQAAGRYLAQKSGSESC